MNLRFGFTILLLAFLNLLVSCFFKDPFQEYRGTNLISEKSAADFSVVNSETFAYVNFEHVSGTGYEPPVSGADVYRLELVNLFLNGDFEAGGTPDVWTRTDIGLPGDTLKVIEPPTLNSINGKTMHFNIDNSADQIDYNIRHATYGAPDDFLTNASYLIRFDYRTGDANLGFEYRAGETIKPWATAGGDVNKIEAFPAAGDSSEVTVEGSGDRHYSFAGRVQEAWVDNIRLIRTDIDPRVRLYLRYSRDTALSLVSGC